MSVYRGDLESVRARFEELRERAQPICKDLQELVEALPVLDYQFQERGWITPAPPKVVIDALPELGPEVTLKQALQGCQELERLVALLGERRDQLSEYARALNERLCGRAESGSRRLGPPPRAIPAALVLLNLIEWRWWHIGILSVWATVFIIVAITAPGVYGVIGACLGIGLTLWQIRTGVRRLTMLRRGKVASVTCLEKKMSYTTSYSGVHLAQARGWDVTREAYSGSQYLNRLSYLTDDGTMSEILLKGAPYDSGVVLVDSKIPSRALCIDAFRGNPVPDYRGAWTYGAGFYDWLGAAAMTLILAGYCAAMVLIAVVLG